MSYYLYSFSLSDFPSALIASYFLLLILLTIMARNQDDDSTAGDSGTATTTPKKTSTHITPFNSITDLTPAKYLAFWDNCTATPATWTPVKVSPENRMAFVDALRDWAETYNIAVFQIPTEGDGTIEATARIVAGKDYANYKLWRP